MIMRKIYILLTLCCALIACKKIEVDFSYLPEAPRAGQAVTFTNLSSGGEEWAWTFGDGGTSTTKSPVYTYKQPGTYSVILKVDNKSSRTCTKEITVYDTIPTFVASDSVFTIYKDYTFTANVYNPYNYDIDLEWDIPDEDSLVSVNGMSITCYFTQPDDAATITLSMTINEAKVVITKSFYIADRETNSVLFRNAEGDYRQRIFGARAEEAKEDASAAPYLDDEQDTMQIYNNYAFYLSDLQTVFPGLLGFKIANRKIYCRMNNGLWVAAIDGDNPVQIEPEYCSAMTLDLNDNRIYWAIADEVRYMPLIGSDNNHFVTEPTTVNTLSGVTKIAVDY